MILQTEEEAHNALFESSSSTRENSLGMVCRSTNMLEIDGITIEQSSSSLYQHSTGAMVWNTTPKFANWIQNSSLRDLIAGKTVIELGSGTGALAMLIAGITSKYIATDQRPLLKLCKRNCNNYLTSSGANNISVCEFDWELHEFDCSDVQSAIDPPVTVVACDTIYNEHLQRPFSNAILSVWKAYPNSKHALVAIQLREPSVAYEALSLLLATFGQIEIHEISPGYIVIQLDRQFSK